jgi:hypothetical protein
MKTFTELQEAYMKADNEAVEQWDQRLNNMWKGPVGIEEVLQFTQRRLMLTSAALNQVITFMVEKEKTQ